ncbi:MAG: histidine phosphatase family protein [Chlamydiia bacterium]|nr:histidine phosphatase family protein [Chlamydiia bacterium]
MHSVSGTEIWLVRHGQTDMNVQDLVGGQSLALPINATGIRQSQLLGTRLSPIVETFDAFFASTALRTQQTAQNSIGDQDLLLDAALCEQSQGDWEGKRTKKEVYGRQDVRLALDLDNWNFIPGDEIKGESQVMTARRMQKWVEAAAETYNGQRVLAFTHGTATKVLLAEIFNWDRHQAYRLPIDNTSITVINYSEDKVDLVSLNNTDHLKQG